MTDDDDDPRARIPVFTEAETAAILHRAEQLRERVMTRMAERLDIPTVGGIPQGLDSNAFGAASVERTTNLDADAVRTNLEHDIENIARVIAGAAFDPAALQLVIGITTRAFVRGYLAAAILHDPDLLNDPPED